MKVINTNIRDLKVIEVDAYGDERGWFSESYSQKQFLEAGLDYRFIQDNHSFSSKKGTLRGMHYQAKPYAQTKLVRCTRGKILDVVVDLRKGSETYLQSFSIELSHENKKQLLIPKGFAHGFITLEENTEIQYKVDEFYSKEHDCSLKFDDQLFKIDWPVEDWVLSEKDRLAPAYNPLLVNFSLKVLVTGARGQVGYDVMETFKATGIDVFGIDQEEVDLRNETQVRTLIKEYSPDVIVHCAAFTNVDQAEEDKENCYKVNVNSTKLIAETCKEIDAKLVFISSDYVFSGEGQSYYSEEDETCPKNYYGLTKQLAEEQVKNILDRYHIIRTSWVYGLQGDNFVQKILTRHKTQDVFNIVDDQVGSPTYSKDLANFILKLTMSNKYGTYHVTNEGVCSWYEFTKYIFDYLNISSFVNPVKSHEFITKAYRPKNSRLSKDKLELVGFKKLPKWQDAIVRYLELVKHEGKII